MIRKFLFFSIALVTAVLSFGQERQELVDKNGNPYVSYTNDDSKARWYTLDNGLTVILAPNHEKPRIQTLIATKAGSSSDPAENTGLAHYLEHMLFKGTDRYGSLDFKKEQVLLQQVDELYEQYNQTKNEVERKHIYHLIDSVSGEAAKYAIANEYDRMVKSIGAKGTNAFTSFERTVYVNDIPANQVETWLDIEAERFRNPILRLFHTELEAVYEEKNRSLDNDNWKVYEQMMAAAFPNHNYGRQTTIGTIDHLKNPSLKKIREYYRTYYVPNNMAVILAGDLDPATVFMQINQRFSYMKPAEVPQKSFEDEISILSPHTIEITGPEAENLTLCYRMPSGTSKDADMVKLIDMIFSNSKAGLIDINMVKAQKCMRARCSPMLLKDRGMLQFSGKPLEGQSLEDLQALFYEQIERVKKGEFEMSLVKSIVLNQEVSNIKKNNSYGATAYSLMNEFIMGADHAEVLTEMDRILQFTKEDIVSFANRYFVPGHIVIYKRMGEKPQSISIEKPEITKVEVNRGKTSPFVQNIIDHEVDPIAPRFLDFENDIEFANYSKNVPIWKVKQGDEKLFSLYYVLDIGSRHDMKLALAVKYLQYLGTDQYSAEEISTKFYDLACNFGVNTGAEQSYVYLSGLASSFDEALELFEHLLSNAGADQAKLDQMVAQMIKGREDAKLNKRAIQQRLMNYALYGERNPAKHLIPNTELKNLTADELVGYVQNLTSYQHKVWYSGPLTTKELRKKLKAHHTKCKKPLATPQLTEYTMRSADASTVYFTDYDMVQAELFWVKRSTLFNPIEGAEIRTFNTYFGGGMGSVVFQDIRESKALAYSTYAYYAENSELGKHNQVMAYVGTQADKLGESIEAMNQLLTSLPVDEGKFQNAKSSIKQDIATRRTVKMGVLFAYDQAKRLGLSEDPQIQLANRLESITMADLVEFHKNRIQGTYQFVLLGSDQSVDFDMLSKHGEIKTLTLNELFGY